MRYFRSVIITAALTAAVGLGAMASMAPAQDRDDIDTYYGPYQRGYQYGNAWDGRPYSRWDYGRYGYGRYGDHGLIRYYDRYDSGRYLHDYDRYDRSPFVKNIYDRRFYGYGRHGPYGRGPYGRNSYYWGDYDGGYRPYGTGYRGLNINAGNFHLRLGW